MRVTEINPEHEARRQRLDDYVLAGLVYWSQVADSALVTTSPAALEAGCLHDLMRRRPAGMTLIGGLKTTDLPGVTDPSKPFGFADEEGWRTIAQRCELIAEVTQQDQVLLDNERTLTRFYEGEDVDEAGLERALAPLAETGLRILFYGPEVLASSAAHPDQLRRTVRLCQAVARAVPGSAFVHALAGYPDWETRAGGSWAWRRQLMHALWDGVEYLFSTSTGDPMRGGAIPCWTPEAARAEASRLGLTELVVYPGIDAWLATGRAWAGRE